MAVWVIIPAAGIGARMQADRPKQYMLVHGQSIISYSLDLFLRMPLVKKLVVAVHPKDRWWTAMDYHHQEKVMTVVGGKTRVDSVFAALNQLRDFADYDDWVLVHDAARPCLTKDCAQRLMSELSDHPVGGVLGVPVVDTLKRVSSQDTIEETVSRRQLWHAQTPQLFRYGILQKAIVKALRDKVAITDESSAVEHFGLKPKMVLGSVRNIKVTLPSDLALVAEFIR